MSIIELTKDQDIMIALIYKQFLKSVKEGNAKSDSIRFSEDFFSKTSLYSSWNNKDISFTLLELGNKQLVKIYIGGNFDLTDKGIYYMENRFKNGLLEVTDFIAKFIP